MILKFNLGNRVFNELNKEIDIKNKIKTIKNFFVPSIKTLERMKPKIAFLEFVRIRKFIGKNRKIFYRYSRRKKC